MQYSVELTKIQSDFKAYYHDKKSYPAASLETLRKNGAVSDLSYRILQNYRFEFTPFSSETPDDQIVLLIYHNWIIPEKLTKEDLVGKNTRN